MEIEWQGQSGKTYTYWIYKIGTSFDPPKGGNYIFTKVNTQNKWDPIYIGQTSNLSDRFDSHHKMPCITRNGATHIHAHTTAIENARLAEESDLLANFNTPCND